MLRAFSESKGNRVMVRKLYETGLNPVLSSEELAAPEGAPVPADVAREQDYFRKADHITFVYPVWWGGMPAVMKGYLDRVLSYDFAYVYETAGARGLLTGKTGSVICTTGFSNEEYEQLGMHDALRLINGEVIFHFCGITPVKTVFFGNIAGASPEMRANWLSGIAQEFDGVL
jgi:NAD(P)H dehydrogenase (quinone)